MSKRLEVLREKFEEALVAAIRSREGGVVLDPVERFASFDPSRNKSATQWLVTTYLNEGFRFEDLDKAYETLLVFSQVKRLLPVSQRSLNGYKTLAGMWKTIEEAGLLNSSKYWVKKMGVGNRMFPIGENPGFHSRENLSSNEEKKASKERAYRKSYLVYQSEMENSSSSILEVVVPLTEFAAQWHGKGTRWCTSADEDNYFDGYNKKAPLIIIREKLVDGSIRKPRFSNKSQLWAIEDDIQFMDASDAPIEKLDDEDARIPVLKWAAGINGKAIKYLPEEHLDREICWAAIQRDGRALQYIPQELIDYDMCMAAVQSNGWALLDVPFELRDRKNESFPNYKLCMAAVKSRGFALQYVPKNLRNYEMCLAAVKQDGLALIDVHDELCDSKTEGFANRKVEDFPNREIYLKAVQQNGWALEYVPKEFLDYQLCLAAVQQNEDAIQYVASRYLEKSDFAISPLNWFGHHLIVKMVYLIRILNTPFQWSFELKRFVKLP